MKAIVRVRLPDGRLCELGHGDIIGRIWSAALHLSDPRVSEMHAAVSLRGATLKLLALRGRLWVQGEAVGSVDLLPGVTVSLVDELSLSVVSVTLPEEVLAIEGDGVPRQILSGTVALFPGEPPRLMSGYRRGAACHIWHAGDGWTADAGGALRALAPGDRIRLGDRALRVVAVPLGDVPDVTTVRRRVAIPLTLAVQAESVHIFREGHAVTVLDGMVGRLLAVVARAGEADWATVATTLWPSEESESNLRGKFDVTRTRLRKRLREADIRDDLVTVGQRGGVKLALSPVDTLRLSDAI